MKLIQLLFSILIVGYLTPLSAAQTKTVTVGQEEVTFIMPTKQYDYSQKLNTETWKMEDKDKLYQIVVTPYDKPGKLPARDQIIELYHEWLKTFPIGNQATITYTNITDEGDKVVVNVQFVVDAEHAGKVRLIFTPYGYHRIIAVTPKNSPPDFFLNSYSIRLVH